MLLRTWSDFCILTKAKYGPDALQELQALLEKHNITKRQILCYINWAAGMTQAQIAEDLGIKQSTVTRHIAAISKKWPYIMQENSPHRIHRYKSRRDDHQTVHKF